ncbi:MAG TPA: PIN domain-containing protein [Patescibacteria group bacterium]|nr:PIN domain-containing protein [Patescibacteria group bacterium]
MRRSSQGTQAFLLDNNVFIGAIKDPTRETATLRLILRLIQDKEISLTGNEFMLEEVACYAEAFESEMASTRLYALISKIEVVEVKEKYVAICQTYMGTDDLADIIHVATCLQTDAILITNNHHFDAMRDGGIVEVWSIAEAIRTLL